MEIKTFSAILWLFLDSPPGAKDITERWMLQVIHGVRKGCDNFFQNLFFKNEEFRHLWLTPIIPATWKAEMGGLWFEASWGH
jgi:hypothetical protein